MKTLTRYRNKLNKAREHLQATENKVRELERQEEVIRKIATKMADYFYLPKMKGRNGRTVIPITHRGYFYRYALEQGIQATLLQEYTGTTVYHSPSAATSRRYQIRKTNSTPEAMEKWERFKAFMKDTPSN